MKIGIAVMACALITIGCGDPLVCATPATTGTRTFASSCRVQGDIRVEPAALMLAANVGESTSGDLFIRNTGEALATVTLRLEPVQPGISAQLDPTDLPPGAIVKVEINFSPLTAGIKSTQLMVSCDSCPNDASAGITAEGR